MKNRNKHAHISRAQRQTQLLSLKMTTASRTSKEIIEETLRDTASVICTEIRGTHLGGYKNPALLERVQKKLMHDFTRKTVQVILELERTNEEKRSKQY